ncbi:MAG TPA: hypothetical protein VML94_00270 [Thermoplasmata archaeon]|nr:hypothetical protein [Thermoplasmata archaeon]
MASEEGDWLRVRGIGRERFAGYLVDYLETLGYTVEKEESSESPVSRVRGRLGRMNPAVPPGASSLAFRLYPTSGGAAVIWESPVTIPLDEMPRMDRLVREITSHLERAIATESHATAKVVRPSASRLPWAPAKPAGA